MATKKNTVKFSNPIDMLIVLKLLLFLFIVLSPVMDLSTHLSFLNHTFSKILMLALICIMCFIDFQLAIIATIAFLVLMINLNKNISKMNNHEIRDAYTNSVVDKTYLDMQFAQPSQNLDIDATKNIVCNNQKPQNEINQDIMSRYIDDKIKPYDMFIKMMTTEDALDKAQGSKL